MWTSKAGDLARSVHRQFRMGNMITAMRVGKEALGALRRPFDRAAADALGSPDADHFFGIDEDLGAEAAADIGRDDPQLVLRRQAVEGRDHQPRHMGILARGIKRVVIGARVIGADRGARLPSRWESGDC